MAFHVLSGGSWASFLSVFGDSWAALTFDFARPYGTLDTFLIIAFSALGNPSKRPRGHLGASGATLGRVLAPLGLSCGAIQVLFAALQVLLWGSRVALESYWIAQGCSERVLSAFQDPPGAVLGLTWASFNANVGKFDWLWPGGMRGAFE